MVSSKFRPEGERVVVQLLGRVQLFATPWTAVCQASLSFINISVGNQPHSEIAALAIFLDRFTEGKALYEDRNGRMTVIPNERGKTVVNKDLSE